MRVSDCTMPINFYPLALLSSFSLYDAIFVWRNATFTLNLAGTDKETIRAYLKRVELYFPANGVVEGCLVDTFLSIFAWR